MFEYNAATNKFEYKDSTGKVVASSPNLSYLKQKVRNLGFTTTITQAVPAGTPAAAMVVEPPPSEFSVDERFEFIDRFTNGVAKGSYLSLVLVGGPGLGKTHAVINALQQLGLKEILPLPIEPVGENAETDAEVQERLVDDIPLVTDGDYIVIKGFSTPKALYRSLYENNGKIILIDDADDAFKDKTAGNILKAALDASVPRYISWMTEKRGFGDDGLPRRFEFTGRIIFISNLEMDEFPAAILSRSVHVNLTLTTAEKIERIKKVLAFAENQVYANQVLDLIVDHAPRFKELSVRTAMLLMQIRETETDDDMFKRMALYHAVC